MKYSPMPKDLVRVYPTSLGPLTMAYIAPPRTPRTDKDYERNLPTRIGCPSPMNPGRNTQDTPTPPPRKDPPGKRDPPGKPDPGLETYHMYSF